MGLCLPSVCRKEYIEELLNIELSENNKMIEKMFRFPLAVKGVDVNPQDYVN